ncbi:MAG: ABC transporter permease [Rhodospirillaceae bacterium]|nr:MAG: ABC transporter permease [Rhodospirillaceae bacterium]
MTRFLAQRLLQAAAVMVLAALIAFLLFNYVGDPVSNMVGQETSLADRLALRERLGLNDPWLWQFAHFVGHAVRGDFGISYRLQRPVSDLLAERLPATAELVAASALFAIFTGVPLGIFAAVRRRSPVAHVLSTLSLVGVSLPTFVIGMGLIYLFAVTLGWLPSFGRGEVVKVGWWTTGLLTAGGLKSLVLPALTLGLFQMTFIQRLVRAEMLEVLQADYIKTARAMGLRGRTIIFKYALRNAALPVITIIGLKLGELIAFSIVTETVFQWPGMGLLFIQAVSFADIPIMAAYLLLVGFVFVAINLVVDVLYLAMDPRLRAGAIP